ncbi:MAG: DUF5703 domain-containing protein, partial [Lentisphaerae bacterium]|nr:DUF5703 domain-containing protein [Lentisphaerota bacterium]
MWYHRNEHSIWKENLRAQGLGGFIDRSCDPLLGRTFGGCIEGNGLAGASATSLVSREPRKRWAISVHVLCAQTETPEIWEDHLGGLVAHNDKGSLESARSAHAEWWGNFWDRSWIRISGDEDAGTVSRAWTLQRWINACGGRGRSAIKFNGSIFSVGQDDTEKNRTGIDDPDYRRWGGAYWWQNTRLPYWSMLASGDYDLMEPLFRMYCDMIPLEEYRTGIWFGHGGAFIGETVHFWGMYKNRDYRKGREEDAPVGLVGNPHIRREYTASPGLMALMLDYYEYTRDAAFLRERLLPTSDSLLEFW